MILGDSWWFSVIHESMWNCFGVILSDLQTTLKSFLGLILSDSWWFANHSEIIWGNSQWFANQSEIVLGWFLVICKPLWNHFLGDSLVILGDSWISLKLLWGDSWWFMQTTLKSFLGWFLVTHKSVWNCFGVILGDSWYWCEIVLGWFSVIHETLWNHFLGWFSVIHKSVWNCFGVILGDSHISVELFWGDSQWFVNHSKIIFGAILCDSQWFVNQCEIVLGWFSVIRKPLWNQFWGDSQQFLIFGDSQTTLKSFLRQFLVIHKSVWNCFGVILGDSLWFTNQSKIILGWFLVIHKPLWNNFWGNSWWFANHSEINFGVILDDSFCKMMSWCLFAFSTK